MTKKKANINLEEIFSQLKTTRELLFDIKPYDWDRNPEFIADYQKLLFVGQIYEVMEEMKMNKNQLAEKLGFSRQYVGRILNESANFTIETMAHISCALGKELSIKMLDSNTKPQEKQKIRRKVRIPTRQKSLLRQRKKIGI